MHDATVDTDQSSYWQSVPDRTCRQYRMTKNGVVSIVKLDPEDVYAEECGGAILQPIDEEPCSSEKAYAGSQGSDPGSVVADSIAEPVYNPGTRFSGRLGARVHMDVDSVAKAVDIEAAGFAGVDISDIGQSLDEGILETAVGNWISANEEVLHKLRGVRKYTCVGDESMFTETDPLYDGLDREIEIVVNTSKVAWKPVTIASVYVSNAVLFEDIYQIVSKELGIDESDFILLGHPLLFAYTDEDTPVPCGTHYAPWHIIGNTCNRHGRQSWVRAGDQDDQGQYSRATILVSTSAMQCVGVGMFNRDVISNLKPFMIDDSGSLRQMIVNAGLSQKHVKTWTCL